MAKGFRRNLDELGRVVIPIEMRRSIGLEIKDPVEFHFNEDDSICIRKVDKQKKCLDCGTKDELLDIEGVNICSDCGKKIYKKLGGN